MPIARPGRLSAKATDRGARESAKRQTHTHCVSSLRRLASSPPQPHRGLAWHLQDGRSSRSGLCGSPPFTRVCWGLLSGGGTAVFSNPGDDRRDCLQRAAECRRKAEAARTLYAREKYLEMEQLWLLLAESYARETRSDAFANTRLN